MIKPWWRGALTLLLALACWTTLAANARADEQFGVGPNPVIDAQLGTGNVTVQQWDRPDVQVSGDGFVTVQHLPPTVVDSNLQRSIPGGAHSVQTAHGEVDLTAEPFVLPPLQGDQHDALAIRGNGNTTIMVPRGTALVMAHVDTGGVTLNDYHGVFYTDVHNGDVHLNRVNGSGYVESLQGAIVAHDSTFGRLRARSATSNMSFQNCTSHQIEATSTYGTIVYNNGSFQPGLARFESEHGNVALGVRGGAQIGAHSENGHVVSGFSNGADVHGNDTTAQARVQGGGPVVTATSRDGSVFIYDGVLRSHPQMLQQMRGAPVQGFAAPRAPVAAPRSFEPRPVREPEQLRQYPGAPRGYVPPQPPRQQFVPPAQRGQQFVPPAQRGQQQREQPREDRHPNKPPQK